MVGGGEFNMNAKSLREIRKLNKSGDVYTFSALASMKHPRHGHSACAVSDKHIVVTGSRIDKAGPMCEIFDVKMNKWADLPQLRMARHYHSSCAFNASQIFVFCGIQNQSKKYMNTVEVLDISLFHQNV